MASETERAWAAGFFDGEGHTQSFKPKKNSDRRYVVLDVTQTSLPILERFREAVGGVGYIYGPYVQSDKRGFKASPKWEWKATSREAVKTALDAMWPWLDEAKQSQAQAALDASCDVANRSRPTGQRPKPDSAWHLVGSPI